MHGNTRQLTINVFSAAEVSAAEASGGERLVALKVWNTTVRVCRKNGRTPRCGRCNCAIHHTAGFILVRVAGDGNFITPLCAQCFNSGSRETLCNELIGRLGEIRGAKVVRVQ
jgi:hypothetical protein